MANFIFQETQRFRQFWIWTILILVSGIVVGSTIFSSKEKLDWALAIPLGIIGLVSVLLFKLELKTRIDQDSLCFSYYPFIKEKKYSFNDLASLEVIEYNGLLEYGGWGIKWNGNSWSYTTSGKYGILVKTSNKKILLGTQKPREAKAAVAQFNEFKLQSHGS
jgi:hypothetical protein